MSTSSEQPKSDSIIAPPESTDVPALASPPTAAALQRTPLRDALATLSPRMRQAFVLTTHGISSKAIIDEVGISRTTLHHWKKYNPKFRAALNAWHQDQVQSAQLSVVAMLPEAIESIREGIKLDPKLAFKLVEKSGGFAPAPAGCISPKQVRQEIKLELRREKLRTRERAEKLRLQEVDQRAQELEDKLEATRIDNMRKMDPQEVLRAREMSARMDELVAQQREARKWDPDFKLDTNYIRAVLYPEEFTKEKVKEPEPQTSAEEDPDEDEAP
jgi:hypothetical protein